MLVKKIIPCLDIAAGRVVKGIHFINLRDAGDPVEAALLYNEQGADELVFLDITATNQDRANNLLVIEAVSAKLSIPLTVGGGISTLDDISRLFDSGVSKASIGTAAVNNPLFVTEAARRYGSGRIVVAIDAKQTGPGRWEVYTHGGQKPAGLDVVEWARRMEASGAGEILLTSMDRDGTKDGFDIELTHTVKSAITIPLTASGGVGTLEHFADGILKGNADAVLAASVFHYGELTVPQVKRYLSDLGIAIKLD